tara:strand:+ start:299 stop:814 length:516 start_codon:yes stop_codon:yes gene_type:complete
MHTSYIITFIGDDNPGLVEALAKVISKHHGNWQESRLSQLDSKFAGIIRISIANDRASALEVSLKELASKGLSVRLTKTEADTKSVQTRTIKLNILGADRPGIVREVSAELARNHFNVSEMHSNVTSAAMTAEPLFTAEVDVQIPIDSNLEELHNRLEEIADRMALDIKIE